MLFNIFVGIIYYPYIIFDFMGFGTEIISASSQHATLARPL